MHVLLRQFVSNASWYPFLCCSYIIRAVIFFSDSQKLRTWDKRKLLSTHKGFAHETESLLEVLQKPTTETSVFQIHRRPTGIPPFSHALFQPLGLGLILFPNIRLQLLYSKAQLQNGSKCAVGEGEALWSSEWDNLNCENQVKSSKQKPFGPQQTPFMD